MATELPSEVLLQIFTHAADEDLIFQYAHPTSLANASWFRHVTGTWELRPSQEAANALMRDSYRTKKAILLTCKRWREVGWELMFRCLFFNSPTKLLDLCQILASSLADATTASSTVGWWARRLHVCRYSTQEFEEKGITNEDMQEAFVTIISHCPNLEIFHVDWPMKEAFGPVANALKRFSRKALRSVTWVVPCSGLKQVIWALDALKNVVVAHIEFEASSCTGEEEDECVKLGSANGRQLDLRIRQLSIRGYAQAFLEQAADWNMPSLRMFTIDSGVSKGDVPDVAGFLKQHGDSLEFLDLNTGYPLPVANLLDYCSQLQAFAFNGDWRIIPNDEVESEIVNRPRPTITTIGLHGLTYAFGVGIVAATASLTHARIMQRSNDMNMAALNKRNFPNLRQIRALDGGMLRDLNEAGQPSRDLGGMDRWERWWDRCSAAGIHLEDCTGDSLGNLPDIDAPSILDFGYDYDEVEASDDEEEESEGEESEEDEEEDDDDDDDEDEDSDEASDSDDDGTWNFVIPPLPSDNPSARTQELRDLLDECRAMSAKREDPSPLFALMSMGGMGGGPSASSMGFAMAESAFQRHYGTTFDG